MIALLCLLFAAPQIEASATVGSSLRRLFFKDRLSPTLGSWQSGALATGGLQLSAYPSTGRLPVLDDIGLYASIVRSLDSQTLTADDVLAFTTRETAWDVGLRYRREHYAVSMGYGSLRHDFFGAQLPGYLLPSGTVQSWRPGAEGRFALGAFRFSAGGAYLAIVRQDFLSKYFPRASKGGVELSARAATTVWKLELALSAHYQRYFYSLHPLPYDPYVAGGALDEVFALDLACGYRL